MRACDLALDPLLGYKDPKHFLLANSSNLDSAFPRNIDNVNALRVKGIGNFGEQR